LFSGGFFKEGATMFTRTLGRSGIQVSAVGMGCWAIGGPFDNELGYPVGWGQVDDAESIRAVHRAMDLGVTLFDTADVYGTGHSERVLGQALRDRRDRAVIATKFGRRFEDGSRQVLGSEGRPETVRPACEKSLRRLQTDTIDLYEFHIDSYNPARAGALVEVLEELVAEGKIRAYGWSTDDPARAAVFAEGPHCAAVQYRMNIFEHNDAMVALCAEQNLAGLIRGPLGRGLLTGKFTAESVLPADDLRSVWNLQSGTEAERLARLDDLRAVLTSGGRSLAQAALGWLWARSPHALPIPGFRNAAQVEENARAADFGPLSAEQMADVEALLAG
jgi:aryl-alcohol dehydrogenase-like predicted oxidoreductase